MSTDTRRVFLPCLVMFLAFVIRHAVADCNEESIRLVWNPMCFERKDGDMYSYLEKAARPTVAIEASTENEKQGRARNYLAAMGFAESLFPVSDSAPPLFSAAIGKEELSRRAVTETIRLDYSRMKTDTGQDGLSFFVCDDTNADGRCSDEMEKRQLAAPTQDFRACHLPSTVQLKVWSCLR